jgi:ribosomal protein L36
MKFGSVARVLIADCFNLSDLQSATPPAQLVTGFRRILISQYPSLKEIDPGCIIIKRHGEAEAISEDSPVSLLAGNTEETRHIVQVFPMNPEVHSGQQKVS